MVIKRKNSKIKDIFSQINQAQNIITSLHISPDADSVGSCLALAKVLKKLGKEVTVLSPNKIPDYLSRLFDTSSILQETDVSNLDISKYDLLLAVDIDTPLRITENTETTFYNKIKTICIDHHQTNTFWADYNYIDTKKGSTCTILYQLFTRTKTDIDMSTGEILLTGLLGDTGIFNYSSTTPSDLRMAANLIELGVNMHEIVWKMTYNESLDEMRFKSIAYSNLVKEKEKTYAYTTISIKNKEEVGIKIDDSFGIPTDYLRKLNSVDFVFSISEKPGKMYSLSFRSHNTEFDVSKIGLLFNGGGHKNAAGGIVKDEKNLKDAVDYVVKTIDKYLESQKVHNQIADN